MRLRNVALAAAGVAAAYAVERAVVAPRIRPDEEEVAAFAPPADAAHHRLATSDGGELHVVDHGQGPPIVLLHGVTLSSLVWAHQLEDLAGDHRVLAVDHRGHGESVPGTGEWTFERLALDVREVLEHFDLRGAVVAGHSLGGMVTLQLAVDHLDLLGDRVAGLVLVGSGAGPMHRLAGWKGLSRALTRGSRRGLLLAERVPGGVFRPNQLSWLAFRVGMGDRATPSQVEINRQMTAATPLSVLAELLPAAAAFDVRERLRSVDVPVLLLVGSRDVITPPSMARATASRLPKAELEVVAGGGHMLPIERRPEVSERLRRFAAQVRA